MSVPCNFLIGGTPCAMLLDLKLYCSLCGRKGRWEGKQAYLKTNDSSLLQYEKQKLIANRTDFKYFFQYLITIPVSCLTPEGFGTWCVPRGVCFSSHKDVHANCKLKPCNCLVGVQMKQQPETKYCKNFPNQNGSLNFRVDL